jgi:hypothetical protein
MEQRIKLAADFMLTDDSRLKETVRGTSCTLLLLLLLLSCAWKQQTHAC